MRVLLFGATGMIGQGVLRECLLAPEVELVQTVGRSPVQSQHPAVRDFVHKDLWNYSGVESMLTGFDACFFCLGVTSAGMSEPEYERITYGIAIAAGATLLRLNPAMTLIFVSGVGADSTEKGRIMRARVKGRTENALLRLPFKAVYVFRPVVVQPLHGIKSRTALYRVLYSSLGPLLTMLRRVMPGQIVTTEEIGRAMIALVSRPYPRTILGNREIGEIARSVDA
ncbi:MAG: epimerase [Acidobacteriota bacterium]|nr:epimerase [Acidobacteriota bacterium]